jgi:hypothetical protein
MALLIQPESSGVMVEEDIVVLWLGKCKRYHKFECNRLKITGTVARANSQTTLTALR